MTPPVPLPTWLHYEPGQRPILTNLAFDSIPDYPGTADWGDIKTPRMNTREFEVVETRQFITLTERGSNRTFRIPVSDAMLVSLAGPRWRTGDVVKLSAQEQDRLEDIDLRCREMGDEAAVRQNKLQNRLGCLSWIALVVVIVLIAWWIIKSR